MREITMQHYFTWSVALMAMVLSVTIALAGDFPGGEFDSKTPQVKLIEPQKNIKVGKEIIVRVEFSRDYDYQPDLATNPVTEYATEGQIDGQGHVHAYFQRRTGDFPINRLADSFCPFNVLNPATVLISNTVVETVCPAITTKGTYRLCVTLETNAHAQRLKAVPRDFPPVDCTDIKVN